MIQYKIYRLIGKDEFTKDGTIKTLIEDVTFIPYNSMEEAIIAIKSAGYDYVDYTILQVIQLY